MSEHEAPVEKNAHWQPFTAALCTAASTWDTELGWVVVDDEHPVPISPDDAEDVMRAIAALSQRMGAATASIVRATAEARLDPTVDEDELAGHVESLGLMALYAEAMHRAADLARAVVVTRTGAA
ncbi:hypothetical protein [Nocardia sp. NRRL S-836]|uniref:hypothetical protein n=1 Tax=Nocardia sp. NRRL S-836 TaxID=1519492 RepID=UPI0006C02281|nr:hypothetical protein [Nocardia sp. NRRL S-836]KOV88268.1 hypothetical protein ADL03_05025 [Nocardia sp. NRRL S-836]